MHSDLIKQDIKSFIIIGYRLDCFLDHQIYHPDICPTGPVLYNICKILSRKESAWEYETRSVRRYDG